MNSIRELIDYKKKKVPTKKKKSGQESSGCIPEWLVAAVHVCVW